MVITMTNEKVTVYDITEQQYEEALLTDNVTIYRDQIIYECEKEKYVPLKMRIELGIGGVNESDNIYSYYYDNGKTMIKKIVDDILDIQYFEDKDNNLWPSEEYCYSKQNSVSLDYSQTELIELDAKLNRCDHIKDALNEQKRSEFVRLYNGESFRSERRQEFNFEINDELLNCFYIVETRGRLIPKDKSKKLTAAGLEDSIYLMAAPAGLTESGEIKYFTREYVITKQDTTEIEKIFRRIIKEYNKKAGELTNDERITFFDLATKEYVKRFFGDMNYLGTNKGTIISNETRTWDLIKGLFLKQHGFPVSDFDEKWQEFGTTTIDARRVENGIITPLTVENYIYKTSLVDNEERKEERRFISEELEPRKTKYFTLPLEDDSSVVIEETTAGDLSMVDSSEFASSVIALGATERSESAELDEYSDSSEIEETSTGFVPLSDRLQITSPIITKESEEMHEVFASDNISDLFADDIDEATLVSGLFVDDVDLDIEENELVDETPKFREPTIKDITGRKDMFEVKNTTFQPPAVIVEPIIENEKTSVNDLFNEDIDFDIEAEDKSEELNASRKKLADVIAAVAKKKSEPDMSDLFGDDIDEDIDEAALTSDLFDDSIDMDVEEDLFSSVGMISYDESDLVMEEQGNYSSVVVYTENDDASFELKGKKKM